MHLWKHNLRGRSLVWAITAASCQAFLLLGYDQGKQNDKARRSTLCVHRV